jgi:NitT/TauT family transport system permease protein
MAEAREPAWSWTSARGRFVLSAMAVAGGLALWQVSSTAFVVSILFPSVVQTAAALVAGLASGEFAAHLGITIYRVLAGFVVGSAIGASLGLVMGSFVFVRRFLDPYVNFFRFITPIAWITPAVIWFGVGEGSKLFLIVYATIFIVLLNTIAGVAHIHRDRLRMAAAFGARAWQVFFFITVPAAAGFILTGMRVALGNSFMTVISAEILSANEGLGYLIYSSRIFFKADVMFAVIVVLGVLGFGTDRVFAWLQHRVLWRYQVGR